VHELIDKNTVAAKSFYRSVREFSLRTKTWETAIFYQTLPDEAWDLTLVSARVYGNRNEFLVIMAAAGLDRADMPLPQMQLILPTPQQLLTMKRKSGFESNPDLRKDFAPTWVS
jgi:hypothetical protein